jgi:F-type H+-transporting ATPase subunit epsilon
VASFPVSLVTPERALFDGEAEMVTMRSGGGDIAFLAGHEPYVSTVEIGLVRIDVPDGEKELFAAHGGFVEVNEGKVVVLSGVAERAGEIDIPRAERARDAAEGRLATGEQNLEAEEALQRANTRLELAGQT